MHPHQAMPSSVIRIEEARSAVPSSSALMRGVEPGNVVLVVFMSIVSAIGIGVLAGSAVVGVGTGLVVLLATILVVVAV